MLDPQRGNDQIAQLLRELRPVAAGKIGASELGGLRHYERRKDASGKCVHWGRHARMLHTNAGVYPANPETFARFCRVFSESLSGLDILAVWFQFSENRMRLKFAPDAVAVEITALEPYYHERPWSSALAGKRVLVVTPFADTVLANMLVERRSGGISRICYRIFNWRPFGAQLVRRSFILSTRIGSLRLAPCGKR